MDIDKCKNCNNCKVCGTPITERCLINEKLDMKTLNYVFIPCRQVKAEFCKPESGVKA